VAEKAKDEKFAVNQQKNRQDLILPILKTFLYLCMTAEFNWHLTKYNALELLNRLRQNEDDKIPELASQVCEKVVQQLDHNFQIDENF